MAPFLATYFQDGGDTTDQLNEDQRLYTAMSADGTTFTPMGRIPTNGTNNKARDFSILPPSLAPDGKWHIAAGNHSVYNTPPQDSVDVYAGSTFFGIDPNPQVVSCAAAKDSGTVQWAWAPEWFKDSDGTVYLIVSTSTNADASLFQFYTWAIPATNASLTAWGTPVKLDGIPLGGIDLYAVKIGSTYYGFVKAGTIRMYTASNFPAGPWTAVHTGSQTTAPDAGGDCEGPNVTNMGGGTYRLYYDKWTDNGTIKFTESSNTFATFSAAQTLVCSDNMRHASIIDLADEPPLSVVATSSKRTQVAA